MRLFTGLDLPEGVREKLSALVGTLRPSAKISWSPPENLHVTTKFIGEWPTEKLDALKRALASVARPGAVDLEVRGLGWFPNPHQPRVFWAGIHASPALVSLAQGIDRKLDADCGIAPETRDYSPHLTLARIKPPADIRPLRGAVAQIDDTNFGSWRADHFYLYVSEPGAGGSRYSKLAEFPLV